MNRTSIDDLLDGSAPATAAHDSRVSAATLAMADARLADRPRRAQRGARVAVGSALAVVLLVGGGAAFAGGIPVVDWFAHGDGPDGEGLVSAEALAAEPQPVITLTRDLPGGASCSGQYTVIPSRGPEDGGSLDAAEVVAARDILRQLDTTAFDTTQWEPQGSRSNTAYDALTAAVNEALRSELSERGFDPDSVLLTGTAACPGL